MIETAQTVIVLASFFLLPGITWGPLMAPGTPPGLNRIGRAAGSSLVVTAFAMTVLGVLGVLRPAIVVLCLVVVTLAPLAISSVRVTVLRQARQLLRVPRRPVSLGLAVAGLALAAVFLVLPSHASLDEAPLPASTTVWYYAHLAQDVAAAGRFPAELVEWGAGRPFQTDYAPFTAHSAAVFGLLPDDAPRALEAYRLAVLVAAFCVSVLLLRRWVSTWLAVVGALLLLGTVRLDQRLLVYRPEAFALVIALFALWLVDRAAVERTPRAIVVAAFALGLVFAAHAEVFLVVLPAAAGIALARGPLRPAQGSLSGSLSGSGRFGMEYAGARRGLAGPAAVLAVCALGAVIGIGTNAAVAGEFRLAAYAGRTLTADDVVPPPANRVPPGWELSGDPTWDFFVAATGPSRRDIPTGFTDPRLLPRSSLQIWPWLNGMTQPGLALLVVLVLLPLALWLRLDARRRRAVVIWLTFGAGLAAGSLALYLLSDWYVPQRVGGRRLMPYELFVPVIAAIVGLWAVDRWLRPMWARLPGVLARLGPIALGAVVAIAAIGPAENAGTEEPGLTRVGYGAFAWMRTNLPPDARILANAYTDGSLTLLSGGIGVLDGRAVYLEDPEFLGETTALLLGARRFFGDPADPAGAGYLADEDIEYLLVVGPRGSSSDLAGYRPFPTDLDALGTDARYTLVRQFGEQRLLLYRVEPL